MESAPTGMYDHPELGNLRRVKPLPKRRRTANAINSMLSNPEYDPTQLAGLPLHDSQAFAALAEYHTRQYYNPAAHGLPPGMTVKDLFAGIEGAAAVADSIARTSSEFSSLYASAVAAAAAHTGPIPNLPLPPEDDDQGESDYVDHLQLPLNTKKRKVPGLHNRGLTLSEGLDGPGGDGLQDSSEGGLLVAAHRRMADGPENTFPSSANMASNLLTKRTTRGSQVTLAALQQKEVVNTRKRQFAAVLEGMGEVNQLALEQALLGRYPQLDGIDPKVPPLRGSRRVNRLALKENFAARPGESNMPTCDFTFSYPSTSSERAISTREEAAELRKRFEEELALQATRAAEAAAKHAAMLEPPPKNRKRAAGGTARTAFPQRLDSDTASGDQGVGKGRQKKKKRSALANASNPHHLRNYVPSRLPQQPPPLTQASLNAANFLSPPPLRFLSAEIPPKRRKKGGNTPIPLPSTLTQPLDEWICATCEYNLFYGDEAAFKRAVKSRKKILSRRRRARERAAAAASGAAPAVPPPKDDYPEIDEADTVRRKMTASSQPGKRERQYAGADASDTLK